MKITATTVEQTILAVVKIQEANECLSIWLHNKYSFNCFPRPSLIDFYLVSCSLSLYHSCILVSFSSILYALISEFDKSTPNQSAQSDLPICCISCFVSCSPKIHSLNCQFTHTFSFLFCHSIRLISLLLGFSLSFSRSSSSLFAANNKFSVVRSSKRRLFTLQQIDLPILGMKSKLVNNEIVTQATNSMCKVTI